MITEQGGEIELSEDTYPLIHDINNIYHPIMSMEYFNIRSLIRCDDYSTFLLALP